MSRSFKHKINWLAFAVFVAAALYAFWKAVTFGDDALGLIPWDKAKHFIVFYVLAVLGCLAMPKSRLWRIGAVLVAFGALIEVVQFFVGRDAAWGDIFADFCGVAAAYGYSVVGEIRRRLPAR
ncbi:VanZ family protein [Caulobacter hibisci]|uniref:VanZ family protein n=1 Tax=Caulobacter hibisci TaxID=2035993 RepID=A0ABS0T500_9CAUL|nr:VanZ family protein [Caulobacter hibisci]MBI1686566.1 VanZ family protein [Caulobacter hibisci]